MRQVRFVDTSVLCNALAVPGKCQDRAAVAAELRSVTVSGDVQLVVPVAAVIETGNHIAQVQDGTLRRSCATRFEQVLRDIVAGTLPWVLHSVAWDAELLKVLCDGPGAAGALTQMAMLGVGTGDVSILAECELYARRTSNVIVTIWTLDRGLLAYAPPL